MHILLGPCPLPWLRSLLLVRLRRLVPTTLGLVAMVASAMLSGDELDESQGASLTLLTSYHQGYRWNDDVVSSVEARFRHEASADRQLLVEYVDALRLARPLAHEALLQRLTASTLNESGSLIIADDPAMAFYLEYRDELPWPRKVVALGLNDDRFREQAQALGVKLLKSYPVMAQSLNMLVETFGSPVPLMLLAEDSEHAFNVVDDMVEVIGSVADVTLVDVVTGWTPEEVIERLSRSPPGTRLYMQGGQDSGWSEGAGSTAHRLEALAAQGYPVFCHFEFQMAIGCAGGAILDVDFLAHAAVELALTPAFDLVPASSSVMAQRHLIDARWYRLFEGHDNLPFQWIGVRGRLEQVAREYRQALYGVSVVAVGSLLGVGALLVARNRSRRLRRKLMVDQRFGLPTRLALVSDYRGSRCEEVEWLFVLVSPELRSYRRRFGSGSLEGLLRISIDVFKAHLPKGWRLYLGGEEQLIGMVPAQAHGPDVESQLDSYLALVGQFQQRDSARVLRWHASVVVVPGHSTDLSNCLASLEEGVQRLESEGWVRPVLRVTAAGPYHETQLRWLCRQVSLLIENPGNQWRLVAQPKMAPSSRTLVGAEVLIRWCHPDAGNIPPPEFLPVILMLGLAERFDRWVIGRTLDWLMELRGAAWLGTVSVNVHLSTLVADDFPDFMVTELARRRLPPRCLALELVEHEHVDDVERVQRQMRRLHERGIGVALDDFGSGYTAFNLLQRLPLAAIKLDYSLLHAARRFDQARQAYAALVGLCHRMELTVVAEGVETVEDASWLITLGVQEGQGYFFAPPMELEDLVAVYGEKPAGPMPTTVLRQVGTRRC